ncbi:MAG TPA: ABC transporter permease, partial [Gemmatimonadaceae bacterium]|nr:ABC transporter permease [Gemmatimonadaceae bacterium]
MTGPLQQVRYTLRSLRGTRALSLAAVGCMLLGMGGAVFILTIANGVLRREPPFPGAERLVRVWTIRDGTGQNGDMSWLDVQDVAGRSHSFDAIEVAARTRAALTTAGGTERLRGESVTPGYFALIDAQPALGRTFTAEEYAPGAPRVLLLGHTLWLRRFGGDPGIVGQTVRLRGSTGSPDEADALFTVVGVMPRGFNGTVDPDHSEFWLPIEQYTPRSLLERRTTRSSWVIARLGAGVSVAAAHAEVAAIGRQLAAEHPAAYRDLSLGVEPVGESWRSRFRAGLTLLTVAAGLLLLIACTNVAYLLLARLAQREHELRLRLALGASRGVIVRQILLESGLLAVAGGAAGVLLAVRGVRAVAAAGVFQLPPYVSLGVDARVVAAAMGLLLVTAMVSGALPAWLAARLNAGHQLREIGRRTTLGRRQRLTIDGLVAAEVAFSFLLLVASALMVRSYANLANSDPGFRVNRLQRLAITLDPGEYATPERQLAFAREVRDELEAQPGVTGVSVIAGVLPPWFDPEVQIAVGGVPRPELSAVRGHAVDEHFFAVMGIALPGGRAPTARDDATAPRVAVVSRSVARALAGGDGLGALGMRFEIVRRGQAAPAATSVEIVGVAEDVRYNGPRGSPVQVDRDIYLPIAQEPDPTLSIAVATAGDPSPLLPGFQRLLGRLAPTSPQHWISTMEEEFALQFGDARLYAWLTGVFGATALL